MNKIHYLTVACAFAIMSASAFAVPPQRQTGESNHDYGVKLFEYFSDRKNSGGGGKGAIKALVIDQLKSDLKTSNDPETRKLAEEEGLKTISELADKASKDYETRQTAKNNAGAQEPAAKKANIGNVGGQKPAAKIGPTVVAKEPTVLTHEQQREVLNKLPPESNRETKEHALKEADNARRMELRTPEERQKAKEENQKAKEEVSKLHTNSPLVTEASRRNEIRKQAGVESAATTLEPQTHKRSNADGPDHGAIARNNRKNIHGFVPRVDWHGGVPPPEHPVVKQTTQEPATGIRSTESTEQPATRTRSNAVRVQKKP